jgi:hypothetical protein
MLRNSLLVMASQVSVWLRIMPLSGSACCLGGGGAPQLAWAGALYAGLREELQTGHELCARPTPQAGACNTAAPAPPGRWSAQ